MALPDSDPPAGETRAARERLHRPDVEVEPARATSLRELAFLFLRLGATSFGAEMAIHIGGGVRSSTE